MIYDIVKYQISLYRILKTTTIKLWKSVSVTLAFKESHRQINTIVTLNLKMYTLMQIFHMNRLILFARSASNTTLIQTLNYETVSSIHV